MKQNKTRHRQSSADEPHRLEHLGVRLIQPHEMERFDRRIVELHDLQSAERVGEPLGDVATDQGQWLALAAWCAPALRLKFREDKRTGRIRGPGVTPFGEGLCGVDAQGVERSRLLWQEQPLGPTPDPRGIREGKTRRHAPGGLAGAANGQGRWLGPVPVPEGRNEIPAAGDRLAKGPRTNKTSRASAIHPQIQTAQPIRFEGGGDYALTVKENRKALVQTLEKLLSRSDFSPSAHGADAGTQAQPAGDSGAGMP